MKIYLKGIKTVAIIFLSLALFSCQDEQIEPIDTLSTESDQMMLRPGKGKGGSVVYYNVELTGDLEFSPSYPLLLSTFDGSTNSKQVSIMWNEHPDGVKICPEDQWVVYGYPE